jgi:hypothetical protein
MEQRIAAIIGNLVMQNEAFKAENEALKARIAELEKPAAPKPAE